MEKQIKKIYPTNYNLLISISWFIVNKVPERIRKSKCKYWHYDNKCETFGIKYKYHDWFLEYTNFQNDFLE